MVPLYKMGDTAPTVSGGWLTDLKDGLDFGMNTWFKIEQMNALKDSSVAGRKALDETVQVESPQVVEVRATPQPDAKNYVDQALAGLKIGTGTVMLVFGAIAFIWFLSNKKK